VKWKCAVRSVRFVAKRSRTLTIDRRALADALFLFIFFRLCLEAHRALELLEDYHAKLTRPQDKQLRLAIERVIRIFKSRLFQALLGESLLIILHSQQRRCCVVCVAAVCVRNEHWRRALSLRGVASREKKNGKYAFRRLRSRGGSARILNILLDWSSARSAPRVSRDGGKFFLPLRARSRSDSWLFIVNRVIRRRYPRAIVARDKASPWCGRYFSFPVHKVPPLSLSLSLSLSCFRRILGNATSRYVRINKASPRGDAKTNRSRARTRLPKLVSPFLPFPVSIDQAYGSLCADRAASCIGD